MKKLNSFVVLSVSCLMATGIAACSNPAPAPHTHTLSDLHEKVDATCHSEGMEAYYSCTGCDKFFDEEKNEVTFEDLKIDMLPHHGVRVEAVNATCTQEGHLEYWACDGGCEKIFSDANCTTETTLDAVRTQKIPHAMRKIDGTPETCTSEGIKDAWMCSSCGDYFEDEAGTVKIGDQVAYLAWTLAGGKILAHGHDTTLVPGEASTCSTNGFKDAYRCKECGDYFENKAGTNKIGNAEAYASWKLNAGKLPLDTEIHDLVKVDGAAPSCTRAGRQDAWFCNDCEKYFSDSEGKNEIGNEAAYLLWIAEGGKGYIPLAEHVFEKVNGKASSCTEHGYKDANQCKYCSDYFEFDEGHARIGDAAAYAAWKTNPNGGQLPLAEHDVDLVPGTPSTCLVEGFADAYKCGDCNNYFYKNEEQVLVLIGNEAQYDSWKTGAGKLPLAPHTGTLVPGEAPTCTDAGYKDAYKCTVCNDYFSDEDCENKIGNAEAYQTWITTGDGYLEPNGHDMELVEGLEETCETNGFKDAYYCEDCKTYFEDELGVTEIGDKDDYDAWIAVGGKGFIAKHPHSPQHVDGQAKDACRTDGFLESWKCSECNNYFSDEACSNKIGDADAYAAWKVGAGKIAKDPHTPGTLIPEVDAERENDGMKAHSECEVCECLLDEEGNPTTEEDLKIPSRLYEFTAGEDLTVDLPRVYSPTETIVIDFKLDENDKNVNIALLDKESPNWSEYFGYISICNEKVNTSNPGISYITTDDGFIRVTFDMSKMTLGHATALPSKVNAIFVRGGWTYSDGVLEYEPSIKAHDLGKLIEAKEAGPHDDTGWDAHYVCQECGKWFDVNGVEKTVEELTRKKYVSYSPASTLAEFANLGHLTGKVTIDLYFENPTVHQEVGINFYNDAWDNYFGTYWVDCDEKGVYFEGNYEGLMLDELEDGWWRVTANIPALNDFVQDKKDIERAQVVDFIYVKGPKTESNRGSGKIELNSTYDSVVPSTKVYSLSGKDKYIVDRSFLANETITLDFKFTAGDTINFAFMQNWDNLLTIKLKSTGTLVDQKNGVQVFKLTNELEGYPTLTGDWWRVIVDLRYVGISSLKCISRIGASNANDSSFDLMINSPYTTDGFYTFNGNTEQNTKIEVKAPTPVTIRGSDGELLPNKGFAVQVKAEGSGKVYFSPMDYDWHNCGKYVLTFENGKLTDCVVQGSANKWPTRVDLGNGVYELILPIADFPGDGLNNCYSIGFFYNGDGVLKGGVTSFSINLLNFRLVDLN